MATSTGCSPSTSFSKKRAWSPFPEYLSFEEAATLPCAAVTAWNALARRQSQSEIDGADSRAPAESRSSRFSLRS